MLTLSRERGGQPGGISGGFESRQAFGVVVSSRLTGNPRHGISPTVMLPGFPRSARARTIALLILGLACVAVGSAWYHTERTAAAQERDAIQRTNAIVTGLAANYAEQINRQILALDQTLDTMVQEWEADPDHFRLETWHARSRVLTGISGEMFLTDENGIVRQSSVGEFVGQNVSDLDIFRTARDLPPAGGHVRQGLLLGRASVNPIMREKHLDAVRNLHHPDGSFAGIIDADYRVSAMNDVFAAASPPGNGFAAVISVTDGEVRAATGMAENAPDAGIANTGMFAAVNAAESGSWVGPSPSDQVVRIHAFRRVPGRDLAVVAGFDQQEALQPIAMWRRQARIFTVGVTGLIAVVGILSFNLLGRGRRRAARIAETRALLAAADARAEISRAQADAASRTLRATFAAVTDGVAIFDASANLTEWNRLFPERSGIDDSSISFGMPMEAVLRAQAEHGYFGESVDVDADVKRRVALLRAGNFGASQTFRADGRVIELRCRPLAEGGFVALYTDVTETRQTRQALRDAREALLREQSSKIHFLGMISHELRARVAMLMRPISALRATKATVGRVQTEEVPRILAEVRRVGAMLADLATEAVEVPRMEAGTLELRPAMLGVRRLLQDAIDTVQPTARDLGITAYLIVRESAPQELIADPGRLHQIVTLLLSEAIRFATPDAVWLLVDGGMDERGENIALRLTIRCLGTPIRDVDREEIFPSLGAIDVPAAESPVEGAMGSGLGPAIARYLTTMMGGNLRCEGWSTIDGRTGNDFCLALPVDLLPGQGGRAPGQVPTGGRPLPRTRILLAGALTGQRRAMVTMLRRDGHMVRSVATGEEAVQSVRLVPFDIVFVDSVLSDMNLDTTMAVIREMAGTGQTVPVIAVATPNRGIEERGWRDSGVDDILAGPETLEDFTAAIRRHVWRNRTVAEPLPGPDEETVDGLPILSADRIAELRANIQAEHLLEMVEECIADLFHRLPALRRALGAGVPGPIIAQAHAMVGMAGGYGMAMLETRLRAILTAVRTQRLDTTDGAALAIEADLARTAAVLRHMLRPVRTDVTI
jgi:DNA-binding response OmpR family regulator/signal transduction histidine kinase